ncbi:MAG: NAD(+) diphosphatase [Deltaproteobacteria bacterium]|nr:NAD(+) diphosphatase [Deltaproteobacteria bacterium]
MYPEFYESTLYLPFNAQSLKDEFKFLTPDHDETIKTDDLWLVFQEGRLLVDESTRSMPSNRPEQVNYAPVFIGLWQGKACRVVTLSSAVPAPSGLVPIDLMADNPDIALSLLSLAALGQQMVRWQKNSQHCSACGGSMSYLTGQWGRECGTCARQHYPHIHPCIIVLITRGDEVLLTRAPHWVAGRYGLVAGFVEPGECLEETLVREVKEETGVEVKNIRYVGSQAWPFPSQIMTGFVAEYAGGELQVDHNELEDARWFSRDNLPQLPSKRSISRYLLDHHLQPK